MAISRAQLVKELEPGLNALFGLEYKQYVNEAAEIFDTETSDRAFEEETTEAATGVKFAVEGTLADGTKIYSTADEWVVGVDIFTLDADGNPVPVPAGEYLLEFCLRLTALILYLELYLPRLSILGLAWL